MSKATEEEIAAENAMYDRLTLAVTEALTTLPTKDLQSWNFRAGLFTQADKIINDVLREREGSTANRAGSTCACCSTGSLRDSSSPSTRKTADKLTASLLVRLWQEWSKA
jgi:hypothetical protein